LALGLLWQGRVEHAMPVALFHSISAFCNAGFSLFADSLGSFRNDPATLVVMMALIVAGGAGFPVLVDASGTLASRLVPWIPVRPLAKSSRTTFTAICLLVPLGALAFFVDGALQGRPRSVLDAVFQSVTTRSAGFQLESQSNFAGLGIATALVLMAIGASAQSTGGGIKTNVIARLFGQNGDAGDEASRPRPLFGPLGLAFLLVVAYVTTGATFGWALARWEGCALRDACFETFSALGTVGLTRDLTPTLSPAGKGLLMLLMFTGRVLYPTLVVALTRARPSGPDRLPWI
jgi:trk system potassium uptake protein TrkH